MRSCAQPRLSTDSTSDFSWGYLAIYRLPRRAVLKGAVSESFLANGTIAAGCSGALALAKLLLLTVLGRIKATFGTVRPINIVDDVVMQSLGGPRTVVRELAGAHSTLMDGFEQIKQPVSQDKAAYLANSVDLARDFGEALRAHTRQEGGRGQTPGH